MKELEDMTDVELEQVFQKAFQLRNQRSDEKYRERCKESSKYIDKFFKCGNWSEAIWVKEPLGPDYFKGIGLHCHANYDLTVCLKVIETYQEVPKEEFKVWLKEVETRMGHGFTRI